MAERAQVTSVEAVEAFRASLILYLSRARPALDEVSSDILRTRQWLQHDQRKHWENELRKRSRKLEQAQAELFSARVSTLTEATSTQQMAVRKALQAVREAEEKLSLLKKWDRELDNRSEPLLKQVEQLHGFLTSDMTKAVAYLANMVKTLEAYAGVMPAGSAGPAPAPPAAPPADAGTRDPGEGAAA
jgi:hypothetical protein